ncbi:hypothetical protein FB451DRAFT_1550456 [Mycena latifolia]|nr:hypothetical protein FB451DRAFT_1550456 [Mycena latifolia]
MKMSHELCLDHPLLSFLSNTHALSSSPNSKLRCRRNPNRAMNLVSPKMQQIKSMSPADRENIFRSATRTIVATIGSMYPDYEQKAFEYRDAMMSRPGGVLGLRWSPLCEALTIVSHGWLDFVYYDLRMPFGPQERRMFNVQVCLAGCSPQEPFDYVSEGVKVEVWDMSSQQNLRARAEDNPETYFGLGGDIFIITYPLKRGQLGIYATQKLQLPF